MTAAQKKAVKKYRHRQTRKGLVRMEVNVPESDRELFRELAARLRAGGTMAERARKEMRSILNPFTGLDLKELIESMPLEELELERSREIGRDIEL